MRFDYNGSVQWGAAVEKIFVESEVQYFAGLTKLLVNDVFVGFQKNTLVVFKAKIAKEQYALRTTDFITQIYSQQK